MEQAPATTTAAPVQQPAGIEGLKKMSVTAGLGSGDYAAVNTLAVASLMGALIGGVLALLANFLLVLPLAAIVIAIISLRQISASNGTQTGRLLAVAAILISLGVAGYAIGSQVASHYANKPDREQLLALVGQLDQRLAARDYAGAYQLTTPQFQARVTEKQWIETFTAFEGIADVGGVAGVEWNNTDIVYQDDPQSSLKTAQVGTLFKYRKQHAPNRIALSFLRQDGTWKLHQIPSLFK